MDLDLSVEDNIKAINDYFVKASIEQKFAVVIDRPYLLENEVFKKNYFYQRLYKLLYIEKYSFDDCKLMCIDLNVKLDNKELEKIYTKSMGVAKFFKFLVVNWPEYDEKKWNELQKNTMETAGKCTVEMLKQLGVENMVESKSEGGVFDIKINFDLSFLEKGELVKNKLTKDEKNIINYLTENEGKISREKVADFRWGEGKYDDFSDQAINQAMRRLGKKLSKYKIRTVPKVGYVLEEK